MISEQEARDLAKNTLSEKRYHHTVNVCTLAQTLAKQYGVPQQKATLAALLHDIAKELPKEKLLQIFADNGIIGEGIVTKPFPVWHGPAAALLAQTQYGITDADILSAIACHTTGKPNMSSLDQIIYIADMASVERNYPEAERLRTFAQKDLRKTAIKALGYSIQWLKQDHREVDEITLAAYVSLRAEEYGG